MLLYNTDTETHYIVLGIEESTLRYTRTVFFRIHSDGDIDSKS